MSRRVYAAGTVLDLIIGSGGAGGTAFNGGQGQVGGFSRVSLSGTTIAQGNGGGGGSDDGFGIPGSPGGGSGDSVTTGGGPAMCSPGNGNAGANGSIVIRYANADDGTAGGTVTVSLGGVVKMSATGGGGGVNAVDGGTAGASGGGIGDQVFTGEGSPGGAAGDAATPAGQAGTAGKVQIRY